MSSTPSLSEAPGAASDEMLELRRGWWLSHGCSGVALYGDDGEMQCHDCRIDFRRYAPREIEIGIKNARLLARSPLPDGDAGPAEIERLRAKCADYEAEIWAVAEALGYSDENADSYDSASDHAKAVADDLAESRAECARLRSELADAENARRDTVA